MAISVGDAVLKLGVDTKDLDKGMKGIGASIKKHQKAIGLGMVAAGGAILAAGALSVKAFAEMGDEVAKMARKTGFSTETLSELRHAAELSGTSLTGLEKATKRMAASIVDAEDGLMETKRAFDKLGISTEEMKGLSPEEAFIKLGEAIAAVEDPILRASIAQDIFGRAGMDLIPMFDAGSEALSEMRQEAHDLGIVFDQEAAKKAEELTDAMHRMEESTSGVKMAIAEELIPVLMPLIENITKIIKGITAWTKEHPTLTKFIVIGTTAFGALLVVLGGLLLLMPGITAATAAFGITLSAAIWPITLVVAAIAALIAIGVLLWKNWDTISAKATEIVFQISGAWNSLITYFNDLWRTVSTIFQGIANAMWAPIRNAIQWIIDWIERLRGVVRSLFGMFGGGVTTDGGEGVGGGLSQAAQDRMSELGLASGGIAMRPVRATVGDVPEAIIPLSRLQGMVGGKSVNIFVELDGRTIGRAIGQPLVDEIRLRTGVRI